VLGGESHADGRLLTVVRLRGHLDSSPGYSRFSCGNEGFVSASRGFFIVGLEVFETSS
jgi:hypothetical protein